MCHSCCSTCPRAPPRSPRHSPMRTCCTSAWTLGAWPCVFFRAEPLTSLHPAHGASSLRGEVVSRRTGRGLRAGSGGVCSSVG